MRTNERETLPSFISGFNSANGGFNVYTNDLNNVGIYNLTMYGTMQGNSNCMRMASFSFRLILIDLQLCHVSLVYKNETFSYSLYEPTLVKRLTEARLS